jgi:hypothetical protein
MAEIQNYVKPRRLYRYRPVEHIDRELRTIEKGSLYCAAYKDMNDPMEGLYYSSKRLQDSDRYEEVRNAILYNKIRLGICSFSEVYNHELMWAHYASQFHGICIAYDFYDLLKYLPDRVTFVRMFYNEDVPSVGLTKRPPEELAKMILSYKNHRWLYEREWRMFGKQGDVFYGDHSCVARVYIGARMSMHQRKGLEARLKRLKIPSSTMKLNGYSLSFDIKPKRA